MSERWWADKVGYQVYPLSFQDSNGDGIGDIPGITSRLDHLSDLGIGFIWLSPVYASPLADNGYDISDYRAIEPRFGTMADMDRLIAEAKARGIGIVMDLVVNHSSDQHAWFRNALTGRGAEFRDFYVWRDPAPGGGPPSDLRSYFGGPAWHLHEATGQYYLALFDPGQPDLNWDNPAMRAEIWDMMRWWRDRGIAGFRMDVIDHIGKDIDAGILTDGPTLHERLQEMHREVLAGSDLLTVGETWSVTPETAPLYVDPDRDELHTLFQFAHISAHWDEAHGKWKPLDFQLPTLKRVFQDWQDVLAPFGPGALFWSNHDLPRAVSSFGDAGEWRVRSARALALALHGLQGTPYIYQGEEAGFTNAGFTSIDEYRDVETLNMHRESLEAGMDEPDFLRGAGRNSRDNARAPVAWEAGPGHGFTTGAPWIGFPSNAEEVNIAADRADPEGVFALYRRLVALRKEQPVLVHGRTRLFLPEHPQVWAYTRTHEGLRLAVVANLSSERAEAEIDPELAVTGAGLAGSVEPRDRIEAGRLVLEPWEAIWVLGAA
ncbi:alpha-glucosidase [Wenxinia saemankumensis]|uniref:Oligo-1,6-glucosidase n=1 Tax=Wenxinia saemankumensis TaxID=1447782 RepID=A0A1M6AJ12_9RHOB|nr:alpha-glucosidase [Wenxinia saemankumensis]SHI36411.1 oligo-1,6-glucosidase [Wenxinia saemankumensis]